MSSDCLCDFNKNTHGMYFPRHYCSVFKNKFDPFPVLCNKTRWHDFLITHLEIKCQLTLHQYIALHNTLHPYCSHTKVTLGLSYLGDYIGWQQQSLPSGGH